MKKITIEEALKIFHEEAFLELYNSEYVEVENGIKKILESVYEDMEN